MNRTLEKIYNKLGTDKLSELVATQLSGTEFNSLMLEIFRKRSGKIKPAQLLKEFEHNRFVQPSTADPVRSMELEVEWLKHAGKKGFTLLTLSPIAPFGTCSSVGTVDQNKVLSSIKGTEVVSDATNVLALITALGLKNETDKSKLMKYATVHRHVRTQFFDNPNFSAHFSLYCMVTGGFDKGSYSFELTHLNEHISLILDMLKHSFSLHDVYFKFYVKSDAEQLPRLILQEGNIWSDKPYELISDPDNKYYQTIQYKIFATIHNQEINIADGGMVDWTRQLTGNKKHRLLISGVGLELMQRLLT